MSASDRIVLNDFGKMWSLLGADVHEAIERVGRSGWYILGNEVRAFEEKLAPYFGCNYGIGCASGLDAIELALRACGAAEAGSKVLTTPLTAFATVLAVVRVGATPVFADVDAHGLIDLDACRSVLKQDRAIRYILPVHLYGHCVDLDQLEALAREFDLCVIEDCAQSIGASFKGKKAGSIGRASATSFYPTKNLGCFGDGGALLTSDEHVRDNVRALRDYGQTSKYVHDIIGLNSRLDEVQAGILSTALLPRLLEWNARRRGIAAFYQQHISNPQLHLPGAPPDVESVWHLFPVLVDGPRDGFMQSLRERGVDTAIHYPKIMSEQRALRGLVRDEQRFPQAERFAKTEVSLPIHPLLTDSDLSRVVDACNAWQT